ncbi:MAG: sensor histidine kinase [Paracoccaceae bacterium]
MISLKNVGFLLILCAMLAGGIPVALWMRSTMGWEQHLLSAKLRGEALYDHLIYGAPNPPGTRVAALSLDQAVLAHAGDFELLPDIPRPAFTTFVSVGDSTFGPRDPTRLKIAAISPKLVYPLSELDLSEGASAQRTLGAVVQLMARYCSDAVLLVNTGGDDWQRIEGEGLWECQVAPTDLRLWSILIAVAALAGLGSAVIGTSAKFSEFARVLTDRQANGRTKPLQLTGPTELRAIVEAVNGYRDLERQHLAERATILSGVSHDLGTPATRIKLRAALIQDEDLRQKLEDDVDQMTGIIESVLTYTRAELSTEEPRKLSLTSLIEAIVADYEDIGRPVRFEQSDAIVVEGGQSVFMSKRGRNQIADSGPLLVTGRPLALKRAVTNLIDNALKYGRRATVRIESEPGDLIVLIEDEGGQMETAELENLTQPFQRGTNAKSAKGFGMGLTIVSSIALEHNGDLTFLPGRRGTIARLRIPKA